MTIDRIRWAAWAVVLTAVGCQPADEIRSYTVPKEVAVSALQSASAESAEPTDRMIVAILRDGERAWFLKVVGPLAEVDRRADELNTFFETVRVAADKPHPDWQLPAGWKQDGASDMRAATLWIPTDTQPLEMSVTPLPWTGGEAELLSNVNRWRGQMQLPPIGVVALADCTRELKAGEATMTIVDLRGRMGSTGMTPPFAQRAGSTSLRTGKPASADGAALPAGHPPIGSVDSTTAAAAAELEYDAPQSWRPLPATGFRKAAFEIGDGTATAVMTVTEFSASAPSIADVLSNLNRWRIELGLAPVEEKDLAAATEKIEIDGLAGTLVDAMPDASLPAESRTTDSTLAAMVVRGGTVWFFKLKGSRELVAAERDNFRAFLETVRLTPDGGAGDGD
jgi:hypothetical protein